MVAAGGSNSGAIVGFTAIAAPPHKSTPIYRRCLDCYMALHPPKGLVERGPKAQGHGIAVSLHTVEVAGEPGHQLSQAA